MERLNDDSIAYQTVHSHYTYTLGIKDHPKSHSTGVIHPDRYNVFAVEMYPDSLSFYVNDIHTFTYPRIQTQKEGQFPFDQPFYLLIDMQLGGSWVGAVDPKDLPEKWKWTGCVFISESHSNKTLNMNIQLPSFYRKVTK